MCEASLYSHCISSMIHLGSFGRRLKFNHFQLLDTLLKQVSWAGINSGSNTWDWSGRQQTLTLKSPWKFVDVMSTKSDFKNKTQWIVVSTWNTLNILKTKKILPLIFISLSKSLMKLHLIFSLKKVHLWYNKDENSKQAADYLLKIRAKTKLIQAIESWWLDNHLWITFCDNG